MSNVSENLFQAMDIIIAERLNGLNYDKTILCRIEDDKKKDKGEYIVTDGSSTFIAISKDATYTKGSSVYVTVPTGDFNQQKLIVGKYIANNEQYATYQAPFELYIDITENLIEDDISTGLVANGDTVEKLIWTWYQPQGQGLRGYTRLGFNAKFRSWLSALDPIAGTYGIRIDIEGTEKTTTEESDIHKNYTYYLTSDEFYGDPYNFDVFYKQEKVFDISRIAEITRIQATFYQDKNSFINRDKVAIVAKDEAGSVLPDNLWVSDVFLSVGYATQDFESDTVLLYTFDSVTYAAESETKQKANGRPLNEKTLKARWIHFDKEGKCTAIDQESEMTDYEENHSAKVHWYKHVLQDGVYDDLAGNFWQEVNDAQESKNLLYTFSPDITAATETYKVIVEMPSRESVNEQIDDETWNLYQKWGLSNPTEENIEAWRASTEDVEDPDTGDTLTRVDAVAKIDGILLEFSTTALATIKYCESDTFVFSNEAHVPDQATLELVQGLSIVVDAVGLKGNYCIYGQTNEILNSTEAHKMRTLEARYESLITNDSRLDKASTIRWKIPAFGTMIYKPEQGKEYIARLDEDDENYKEENELLYASRSGLINGTEYAFMDEEGNLIPIDGYYIIERKGTEEYPTDADEDGVQDTVEQISVMQDFRIESYYTPQNTNNTVHCEILKNGLTYKTSSTLIFGPQGTNGTDSTLVLKFKDDQAAIGNGEKDKEIIVEAHLYDYNNNEVEIEDSSVSWSWWKNAENIEASDGNLSIETIPKADWPWKTIAMVETDAAGNELSTERSLQYPVVKIKLNAGSSEVLHNILQCNVKYGNATIGAQAVDGVDLENNETLEEEIITREVDLQAFIPIPYRDNSSLTWAEVPTRIVYDDQGKNAAYYKNAFAITTSGSVEGYVSNAEIIFDDVPGNYVYYPGVKHRTEESSAPGWFLEPKNMFFNGLTNKVTLKVTVAFNNNGQITYYNWYQPILIIQNRWPSAMMNAWDGSLTIDEKNGTILSTMVGAGKKESDNTFTGVLMGDIATGAGYADKQLGVYGFNHGQQSFGFKDDGTAFIGKAGKGRIEFDGNSGRIQSMSYSQTKNQSVKSGMLIDLDDGIIEMHGATKGGTNGDFENNTYEGSGAMIRLNVADNSEPYFEIHTATEDDPLETDPTKQQSRPIMIVGLDDYRLQSADFKQEKTSGDIKTPGSGMQIDLNRGYILGYDFELKGVDPDTGSYFYLNSEGSSSKPYFRIFYKNPEGTEAQKKGLNLINITQDKFLMQSQDWVSGTSGTQIDLSSGKINSYSFDLYAKGTNNNYIKLSSTDSTYPLNINNGFKVKWDGSFSGAGTTFSVDASGKLKATGGSIGGWTINEKTLTATGLTLNSNGSMSGGSAHSWSIATDGTAKFSYLEASGGSKLGNATIDADGNLDIGQLTMGGNKIVVENVTVLTSVDLGTGLSTTNFTAVTDISATDNIFGLVKGITVSKRTLSLKSIKISYKTIALDVLNAGEVSAAKDGSDYSFPASVGAGTETVVL